MVWCSQPGGVRFQQVGIVIPQCLYGRVIQPGALECRTTRRNDRADAAEYFKQSDKLRAPQAGSANCNEPVFLLRGGSPQKLLPAENCLQLQTFVRMTQAVKFLHSP